MPLPPIPITSPSCRAFWARQLFCGCYFWRLANVALGRVPLLASAVFCVIIPASDRIMRFFVGIKRKDIPMFKSNIIFPMAVVLVLLAGILSACGGGTSATTSQTAKPQTGYRVEYAYTIAAPATADRLFTLTIAAGDRYLTKNGVSVAGGSFPNITIITPGGVNTPASHKSQLVNFQFTLKNRWWPVSLRGTIAARSVYVADFPDQRCDGRIIFSARAGTSTEARRYRFICRNSVLKHTATTTIYKTEQQLHGICWRDNRRFVFCDGGLRFYHNRAAIAVL